MNFSHDLPSSRMFPDYCLPALADAADATALSAEQSPGQTTSSARIAAATSFVAEFYENIGEPTSLRSFPLLGSSGIQVRGRFWTLNSLAPHSADDAYSVSSLVDTLETWEEWQARGETWESWSTYISKFFLSPTACAGILTRAGKRGRAIPSALRLALTQAATTADSEPSRESILIASAHPPAVAYNWQSGGDVRLSFNGESSPALSVGQVPAVGVRRLTPRETERLQGFPDDWTQWRIQNGEIVEQSDSARYRQMGNAVSVPVAQWIARRIVEANQ